MNYLSLLLLIFLSSTPALAARPDLNCNLHLTDGLNAADAFVMQTSVYTRAYGRLPKLASLNGRLVQIGASAEAGARARILNTLGVSEAQWRLVEQIEFARGLILGSKEFQDEIENLSSARQITDEQASILRQLGISAEAVRSALIASLMMVEENRFKSAGRLMTEAELDDYLRAFTREPKSGLRMLIYPSAEQDVSLIQSWRYRLLLARDSLRQKLLAMLRASFRERVAEWRQIPESELEVASAMAKRLGITQADLLGYFGDGLIAQDFNSFMTDTIREAPKFFAGYVNRGIHTDERTRKMLDAIRTANHVVFFKLAENQDLGDFAAIEQLAEALDAPIVVSPAFSEIGLMPERLQFLFDHPRVHIQIDPILQLNKDFYVINNGAPDKLGNPLVGLDEVFPPTSRVLVMHPRVITTTRASGYYNSVSAFTMTTGSMSIPSYRSEFNVGMTTDFRAQQVALKNRGLVLYSRRYPNNGLGRLVGSAFGSGVRRVPFVQAHYGNPAGLFDINQLYTETGVIKIKSMPAIIWPDIHIGGTDPAIREALFKHLVNIGALASNPRYGRRGEFEYLPGELKIGALVLHDAVNGDPFNGHTLDRLLTRAKMDAAGLTSIERHFKSAAAFLNQLAWLLPSTQIVIPVDNHGYDWIQRTLEKGDLWRSSQLSELHLILRLMLEQLQKGGNPYERLMQYYGVNLDRVRFMGPHDQLRVAQDPVNPNQFSLLQGVEVGQHSHMGINGSKSISVKSLLSSYGAIVGGHQHATQELGQARRVGAATPVVQDYHRGPSTNSVSLAHVYAEDGVQILSLVKGSFLPSTTASQAPEDFYPEGFPRLERWPNSVDGGLTTDQYRNFPPVTRVRRSP